jgi:hypothetical protein
MKTKEQLEKEHKIQLEEQENRKMVHLVKINKYKKTLMVVFGSIWLINYIIIGVAFNISWFGYIYAFCLGSIIGYLLWVLNRGIIIGMMLCGMIGVLGLLILTVIRGIQISVNGIAGGMGSLMVLVFSIAGWVVIGGIAGYLRETFDNDNLQI